ncbi:TetR-like C-terminal domain-containing protein [Streptomyces sulphureus]|uniref:TetR-like C-terminal domain-containing protein n=1 Tax=Streptomyces sulphureus TaxID=47758 RepID=UPI00035DCA3C|nr:TetR-like C-terminal domain-containing protein [Streptomyces sulphureus]
MTDRPAAPGRSGYHHGDLRNALTRAATALAREGGPQAVVLRAAARATGVSPTAAYRHFRGQGDLLRAVKFEALARLADRMEAAGADHPGADGESVVARLRSAGRAYVRFALDEPGLFRAAFSHHPDPTASMGGARSEVPSAAEEFCPEAGAWDDRAFRLLSDVMDALLDAGLLAPERRPGAEVSAWAAVHGVAMLLLDGPLSHLSSAQAETAIVRTVDDMLRGILEAPSGETHGT